MTTPISTTPAELTFASLGLSEPLMQALAASGYTIPTPIQAQAIPPLLAGKDLLGLAETGTGKTAAFALPILQALAKVTEPVAPRTCRALILAPTRELAIQIGDSIEIYGKQLKLRHTVVFGGVGSRPQIRAMDRGVDILVATPGRLLDLMGTRNVNLHRDTFFVLDEADRMLDMGFIRDVKRVVKELPKVRQSLMFSATMPQDISSLAHEILHNPVKVEIARTGKTVDRIEQFVHFVDTKTKRAALATLLKNGDMRRVIVFARTKHGADRVARGLAASGIGAFAIHGNKSQNARQDALESFRTGKARVLVATDIAARGIDIDDITHVVNYDIPNIPESYVHRIGRTARAGNAGVAIALCAPEERAFLRDIERLTRKPLTVGGAIEGIAETAAALPPIPSKGEDREDGQHFERGRGRISGRRHMPHTRPATAWRDTDPLRPVTPTAVKPQGERGRDDRNAPRDARPHGGERRDTRPFNRDDRGSERRGPSSNSPRGDRPREDKPWSNRPGEGATGSDRPRGDTPRGDFRGDRPHGDRPQGSRSRPDAPRGEGRPLHARPAGERRDGERRGPPRDGAAKPFDGHRSNGDRPRGDRPDGGRPSGDRARTAERHGGASRDFKRPDRAAGPAGPAKPWQSRDEGRAPARGDDRRPHAPRPEAARRPEARSADGARPINRWSTGERPRGGDRPRRAEGTHERSKPDQT